MRFSVKCVLMEIFEKAALRETQPEGLNLELNPSSIQIASMLIFLRERHRADRRLAGLLNSQSHDSSGVAS